MRTAHSGPQTGFLGSLRICQSQAERWGQYATRKGFCFVPGSVDQAFEWLDDGFELRKPESITINESGKYPEIVNYQWAGI